jgi:nucleotide-binding universal stress UspA family protein
MKRIIAAVDFSAISDDVIERAVSIARAFSAQLVLLHVAAPDPDFVGYDAGPQSVRDQVARHLREEHRDLQSKAADLREAGIDATALLIQGPTADTILTEAKAHHADLIIMGSHGHGAMHRALMGSVSEGVLRKAPCPVMIIPHQVTGSA